MSTSENNAPAAEAAPSIGAASGAKKPQTPQPAASLKVAYFDGPPGMQYFGRRWTREEPQEVTAEEWAAMQLRADCARHHFKTV